MQSAGRQSKIVCVNHHVYVEFLHSGEIVCCISFVCAWGWVASCAVKVTAHHWVNHILPLSSFMVKTHRTQWEAKFTLILFCMGAYERLKWYDIKCQPKSLHPLVFLLNVLLLSRVLFHTISVYCTKSLPAILSLYKWQETSHPFIQAIGLGANCFSIILNLQVWSEDVGKQYIFDAYFV